MVGQGACTLGSVAQIKEHHDLLVFGQTQRFCQLVRVKKVDPAAVYACIGSASSRWVATMAASSMPEFIRSPG